MFAINPNLSSVGAPENKGFPPHDSVHNRAQNRFQRPLKHARIASTMEATNNDMTEQATTTEQATAPIGMAANTNEKNLNAMASEQSHEDTAALVDLATNPVASPEELSSYVRCQGHRSRMMIGSQDLS